MNIRLTLAAILLGGLSQLTHAQTAPALPDFSQTPMRVQELRGQENFLYGEADSTMAELGQTIRTLTKPLIAARDEGKVQFAGQMVVTFVGTPGDRMSPMKVRAGFPVRPGATAPEGLTLGKLESRRAATSVFSGNIHNLQEGFTQLYTELAAAGLEPVGEMRQLWAYFEGAESDNNVFILQVLVK